MDNHTVTQYGYASCWKAAPGSFVFSLLSYGTIPPCKLPLKNQNDLRAIVLSSNHEPSFGVDDLMFIYQDGSKIIKTNFGNTYEHTSGGAAFHLTGNKVFNASEVEVLHLA